MSTAPNTAVRRVRSALARFAARLGAAVRAAHFARIPF